MLVGFSLQIATGVLQLSILTWSCVIASFTYSSAWYISLSRSVGVKSLFLTAGLPAHSSPDLTVSPSPSTDPAAINDPDSTLLLGLKIAPIPIRQLDSTVAECICAP